MARKPNYSFERMQRERAKAAKREAKREAKAKARAEKARAENGENPEAAPDAEGGDGEAAEKGDPLAS